MPDFETLRHAMIETQLRARGISDPRVLDAMRRVPRHEFVPGSYVNQAYEDCPLPIGESQTISQPYIVALMLQALQIQPADKVLEVGGGSGYATALLAELASQVYSIERHESLAASARQTLSRLACAKAQVLTGDGSLGLPAAAPFDAILVSAAALSVPAPLVDQLQDGGRMIVPIGTPDSQELQFIRKIAGRLEISPREAVRFVPLIGSGAPR